MRHILGTLLVIGVTLTALATPVTAADARGTDTTGRTTSRRRAQQHHAADGRAVWGRCGAQIDEEGEYTRLYVVSIGDDGTVGTVLLR